MAIFGQIIISTLLAIAFVLWPFSASILAQEAPGSPTQEIPTEMAEEVKEAGSSTFTPPISESTQILEEARPQAGTKPPEIVAQRAQSGVGQEYEIRLPSRGAFIPQPGIPANLTGQLLEIIAGRDQVRAHLFVQLYRPPSSEDRVQLARQGVDLLAPLNRYTWRASVSANGARTIGYIEEVRWADVIRPEDKLAEAVQPGIEPFSYQMRPTGRVAYSVLFHQDVTAEQVLALSDRIDVELENFDANTFPVVRAVTVTVPLGGIAAVANADIVAWIEAPPPPYGDDNRLNAQPLSNVDVVQAPPFNLDGTGITVGVWEAGDTIDAAHLDLTPRVTVEAGQTANNDDHAAHVAGTIGASGVNQPNAEGMAPNVTIASWDTDNDFNEMTQAVTSPGGPGQPTPIQISNHSYSSQDIGWNEDGTVLTNNQDLFGRYSIDSQTFDNIVFQNGLVVVKSAGNERNDDWDSVTAIPGVPPAPVPPRDCTQGGLVVDADCIGPLGSAKNVITVGAMDGAAGIADFSSYGPISDDQNGDGIEDDGRIKPDLMAQGVNMLSLACTNCFSDDDGDGIDDVPNSPTATTTMGGTSMSTPVVSGIAALVLQDADALDIEITPARMKALLVQTAEDVSGVGQSNDGPDYATGWGIVDAEAAITLLREGGITGGTLYDAGMEWAWTRPFTVVAGQPEIHVTLAWDDPPGIPGGQILRDDLDLRLIAPDGTVFTPWILDPDNPANAAVRNGGNDDRNNVEQVSVLGPMPGVWTAQVSAELGNLPEGPQDFALSGPVGLTIVEPTEAHSAWAGTSTDGNRVFVNLVGAEDMDMSLANLSIVVDGVELQPDQIAIHGNIESETWLVIKPGARPIGCYDLTVSLIDMPLVTDTAPQSLCYRDEGPTVDRVIAIDRTTSMLFDSVTSIESSEKMDAARKAAPFFTELSNDRDGIGVVSFQRTDEDGNGSIDADEFSEVEFPRVLADEAGTDRRPDVNAAIANIEPGRAPGGEETSLGAGLLEAKKMLDTSARADSDKIIVLITDGRENFPPYWSKEGADSPVKPDFVRAGIQIDTVSIGLDADNEILRDMTDSTGGEPYNQLEGIGSFGLLSRLAKTFKVIDEGHHGEQRFYYQEGFPDRVVGGEFLNVREGYFFVEPHLDWMTAAFHWNVDDAVIPVRGRSVRLIDPDGVTIDTTRRTAYQEVYHVVAPKAGVWRYQVTINRPERRPADEFFAAVSGPTSLTAGLRVDDTIPSEGDTWETPLRVWIAENDAVLDTEVTATIRRPDKIKLTSILRDNGTSFDGDRRDGIYGVLTSNTLSGPYAVDVVARGKSPVTGEPFERFLSGSFLIPGNPDSPGQVGEVPPGRPDFKWCYLLWLLFIISLITTLILWARYLCDRRSDRPAGTVLWLAALALAITTGLGWWLLRLCQITPSWFSFSIALAFIIAGLLAFFTPLVPCIGMIPNKDLQPPNESLE